MVPLFEERYGIEVEVITGGTGELLARIDAEGDAPYCDVIFGGGESSYSEYKHVFQDYVSPEDANLIESCRNTLGYCTNYNLDSAILMYNTDLIGDIQIKGYKDLLNPELKGKIASADPTASSSAMMHIETILTDFGGLTLENEEGWGFVSDLIKNLDGKLASGSSAAWKSVADGEMTVVLTYEEAGISLARLRRQCRHRLSRGGHRSDPRHRGPDQELQPPRERQAVHRLRAEPGSAEHPLQRSGSASRP